MRRVPYYRCLGLGPGQQLTSFPLVSRATVQANYGAFLSDAIGAFRDGLLRTLGRKLPAYEVLDENGILIGETSGTSGLPLRCVKSLADRLTLGAGIWRQRRRVDPQVTPDNLYRFIHTAQEPPRFDPKDLSAGNLAALYQDLVDRQSRWLHANPSMLLRHAAVCRPTLPDLRFVECSGEFLDAHTTTRLEEVFGSQVLDQYGMMECWTIGLRCRHGVHHLNDHNIHLEILNRNDKPCAIEEPGQLVITTLRQELQPFIRYVTNDYGMWVEAPCDCRLGSQTFVLLNGRSTELVAGCDNLVFGNTLFADAIRVAHRRYDLNEISHIRVIQTAIDAFVVRTNAISASEQLCAVIREEVTKKLGRAVRVDHAILPEQAVREEAQAKPWLFRRAML